MILMPSQHAVVQVASSATSWMQLMAAALLSALFVSIATSDARLHIETWIKDFLRSMFGVDGEGDTL